MLKYVAALIIVVAIPSADAHAGVAGKSYSVNIERCDDHDSTNCTVYIDIWTFDENGGVSTAVSNPEPDTYSSFEGFCYWQAFDSNNTVNQWRGFVFGPLIIGVGESTGTFSEWFLWGFEESSPPPQRY